jgi:hypothetical protein
VVLQVAQVLLTLPYSFSQLGMLSGILLQIFYGFLGSWTAYLISVLYVEYRSRKEKEGVSFKNHVIQVWLLLLASSSSPLHFLLLAITCVTDYSFVPFHPGSGRLFCQRKKMLFWGFRLVVVDPPWLQKCRLLCKRETQCVPFAKSYGSIFRYYSAKFVQSYAN